MCSGSRHARRRGGRGVSRRQSRRAIRSRRVVVDSAASLPAICSTVWVYQPMPPRTIRGESRADRREEQGGLQGIVAHALGQCLVVLGPPIERELEGGARRKPGANCPPVNRWALVSDCTSPRIMLNRPPIPMPCAAARRSRNQGEHAERRQAVEESLSAWGTSGGYRTMWSAAVGRKQSRSGMPDQRRGGGALRAGDTLTEARMGGAGMRSTGSGTRSTLRKC